MRMFGLSCAWLMAVFRMRDVHVDTTYNVHNVKGGSDKKLQRLRKLSYYVHHYTAQACSIVFESERGGGQTHQKKS